MTPKSLLRHKRCISYLEDFTTKTRFHRILEDHAYLNQSKLIKLKKNNNIKKVIMCSGKIYFDLLEAEKNKNDEIVFIRIEQLYPFLLNIWEDSYKSIKKQNLFGVRRANEYGSMEHC